MTPNPHRGSDFADFLAEQDLMTPTMTPTKDLADALRRYNAWRLGDWAEPMPEPQEITRLLDAAADRLEELEREIAVWKHEAETLRDQLKAEHETAISLFIELHELKERMR